MFRSLIHQIQNLESAVNINMKGRWPVTESGASTSAAAAVSTPPRATVVQSSDNDHSGMTTNTSAARWVETTAAVTHKYFRFMPTRPPAVNKELVDENYNLYKMN